jgi:hypothetical protein
MDVHVTYFFSVVHSSYVMLVLQLSPYLLSSFPTVAYNCQFILGRYQPLGNCSVLSSDSAGQPFKKGIQIVITVLTF